MQKQYFCKAEKCVWRKETGQKAVCARAVCPFSQRTAMTIKQQKPAMQTAKTL